MNNNNDLISRQDAIGAVRNSEVLLSYDSEWSCDVLAESAIEQTRDCLAHALKALPSAEAKGDLIRREDAIEAVVCHIWHMPNEAYRQFNCENIVREVVEDAINRIQSAEADRPKVVGVDYSPYRIQTTAPAEEWEQAMNMAIETLKCEPCVIRCEKNLAKEDFEAIAKRIHEENKNVVVIPYEAEVVSTNTSTNISTKPTNISTNTSTNTSIEALQDRPTGTWTNQHEDGHGFWCGTCDHCGKEGGVSMFCPNCGAKMYKGGDVDEVD